MADPIKIRTVFMGTSTFAEEILKELLSNRYNIISVYTAVDKKTGREQEVRKSAIKILAEKYKIPVLQPEEFGAETVKNLKEAKPDLLIVAEYGKILPELVLQTPGFGAINVHPSLLPKWRGPSPVQNALLEGESETGSTIMLMNAQVDAGDILSQKKIAIGQDETFPELLEKLAKISAELLLETIPLWIERKIKPKKQDEAQASYCQLIERSDGRIIWSDSALSIYNLYRALTPWPGIFAFWPKNGEEVRIKLSKVTLLNGNFSKDLKMGEIFSTEEKVAVKTSEDAVIIEEIQLEGKPQIKISDFINGYPDFIGSVLK